MSRRKMQVGIVAVALLACAQMALGSYSSNVTGAYYNYANSIRGVRSNTGRMLGFPRHVYTSPPSSSSGSFSSYEASDLAQWDLEYSAGVGFEDTDFQINQFGGHLESDTTTLRLGLDATKDRFIVMTEFQYADSIGEGPSDGVDSRATGISIMPGYRLWTQEENGLDVAVFGILDVGYVDGSTNIPFTAAPNQWRMSPGAGATMGYMSEYGLFQVGYTYHNSRNIDGDAEVTGKSYMNIHSIAGGYTVPLTKTLLSTVGIDYTTVNDTAGGLADEFTMAQVGLATRQTKNWRVSGYYYESVDSSDTRGFNATAAYMW
jgi:hypothetical protein